MNLGPTSGPAGAMPHGAGPGGLMVGRKERAAPPPAAAGSAPEREALESGLFRWMLLLGCGTVVVMWVAETALGTLLPWNRWVYPVVITLLMASWAMLGVGGAWNVRGRLLAALAVNAQILAAALLTLLAPPQGALNLMNVATNMFWLPMGYAAAYVALAHRQARMLTIVCMLAFVLPVTAVYLGGGRPYWPSNLSTWLMNIVLGMVIYVPMLSAIARMREHAGQMEQRLGAMASLALRDDLTGLDNRRAALDHLAAAVATAHRAGECCAVLLMDLDHFKRVNDERGHAVGDAVLTEVGAVMQAAVRTGDRPARWGGEEFLVVASATGLASAVELAERLRRAVTGAAYPHSLKMTISVGVAEWRPGDGVESLLQRADAALYRAKAEGRDRVCC